MGGSILHDSFGFLENGDLQDGEDPYTFATSYVPTGGPHPSRDFGYLMISGGGSTALSSYKFYPDFTKNYRQITYVKTLVRDSSGDLSGGHIGLSHYDKNNNKIDLRSLGGRANTTLSRDLSAGDSHAYVNSNADWSTSSNKIYRHFCLYPASHPDYSTPYEYTRIGYGDYNIYYSESGAQLTAEGDYKIPLTQTDGVTAGTFPDIGYSTSSGTPVMNGRAGSSYVYHNYLRDYPEEWTPVTTYNNDGVTNSNLITGFGNDSLSSPAYSVWRYGTVYAKFLILRNYTYRNGPNDSAFGIANLFLGVEAGDKDYKSIV